MDRRDALAKLGVTVFGGSLLAACHDEQSATGSKMVAEQSADNDIVELLFVQRARGMKFDGKVLTLVNVDPDTLYFADRPHDIAGYLSFEELIKLVGTGPDNFNDNPPNATLIVLDDSDAPEAVMELSGEPYRQAADLVFPSVNVFEGELPAEGGVTALFIDTVGNPLSPGSVAGVHRRHKRRRRRRVVNN